MADAAAPSGVKAPGSRLGQCSGMFPRHGISERVVRASRRARDPALSASDSPHRQHERYGKADEQAPPEQTVRKARCDRARHEQDEGVIYQLHRRD